MADVWRNPYHVVIEVENRQCRMLKKFASRGIKHLKVLDIRSSSSGSVKHLIELDREQVKKSQRTSKSWCLEEKLKASPPYGLKAKAARFATAFSFATRFSYQEKVWKSIL